MRALEPYCAIGIGPEIHEHDGSQYVLPAERLSAFMVLGNWDIPTRYVVLKLRITTITRMIPEAL